MNYQVTVSYVDFPMGVSPAYPVKVCPTETEAKELAEQLNREEEAKNPNGTVYAFYDVKKST
jgi:hypothetical protein